jgi:hypothetical protein
MLHPQTTSGALTSQVLSLKGANNRTLAAPHGLRTADLGEIAALGFEGQGLEKLNPLLAFTKFRS